ncbi:MAG: DUF1987 domain-containing protein [Bacteroidales bacterium]|nr:DUF1987 domain-containing protein [Bacteroidales bacterium]
MNDLKINSTRNTPTIEFCNDGNLLIEGRAFSEDPKVFFEPLLAWLQSIETRIINLEVKLDYLNTAATKYLKEMIKTIDANSKANEKMIKWYYEEDDEDILEVGQLIEEITFNTQFFYLDMVA